MEPRKTQENQNDATVDFNGYLDKEHKKFVYEGKNVAIEDLRSIVEFLNTRDSVTKLDLSDCDFEQGVIAELQNLQFVSSLAIERVYLTSEDIRTISNIQLDVLSICFDKDNPEVFEKFVECFNGHETIQTLIFEMEKIKPREVQLLGTVLASMPSLDHLDLQECNIKEPEILFKMLASSNRLTKLSLYNVKINGEGIKELAKCANLTSLRLNGCMLEENEDLDSPEIIALFQPISTMLGLNKIELTLIAHNDVNLFNQLLSYLLPLKNLKNLICREFDGSPLPNGDETLPQFSHLTQLECINLRSGNFNDQIFDVLKHLPNLKKIKLEATAITGKGLAAFRREYHNQSIKISSTIRPTTKLANNPVSMFQPVSSDLILFSSDYYNDEILIEIGRAVIKKKAASSLDVNLNNAIYYVVGSFYINTLKKIPNVRLLENFSDVFYNAVEIQHNVCFEKNSRKGIYEYNGRRRSREEMEKIFRAKSSKSIFESDLLYDFFVISIAINQVFYKNDQINLMICNNEIEHAFDQLQETIDSYLVKDTKLNPDSYILNVFLRDKLSECGIPATVIHSFKEEVLNKLNSFKKTLPQNQSEESIIFEEETDEIEDLQTLGAQSISSFLAVLDNFKPEFKIFLRTNSHLSISELSFQHLQLVSSYIQHLPDDHACFNNDEYPGAFVKAGLRHYIKKLDSKSEESEKISHEETGRDIKRQKYK